MIPLLIPPRYSQGLKSGAAFTLVLKPPFPGERSPVQRVCQAGRRVGTSLSLNPSCREAPGMEAGMAWKRISSFQERGSLLQGMMNGCGWVYYGWREEHSEPGHGVPSPFLSFQPLPSCSRAAETKAEAQGMSGQSLLSPHSPGKSKWFTNTTTLTPQDPWHNKTGRGDSAARWEPEAETGSPGQNS